MTLLGIGNKFISLCYRLSSLEYFSYRNRKWAETSHVHGNASGTSTDTPEQSSFPALCFPAVRMLHANSWRPWTCIVQLFTLSIIFQLIMKKIIIYSLPRLHGCSVARNNDLGKSGLEAHGSLATWVLGFLRADLMLFWWVGLCVWFDASQFQRSELFPCSVALVF